MSGTFLDTPIGQLNQRITIQPPTLTPDGQGGNTVTWDPALQFKVWANIGPLTSREALMAQQLTAVLTDAITIWYRSDLSVKNRIVLGTRTLAIASIQDPTGFHDELRLLCAEVQS